VKESSRDTCLNELAFVGLYTLHIELLNTLLQDFVDKILVSSANLDLLLHQSLASRLFTDFQLAKAQLASI
jgi:hypothetical protein